MKNIAVIVLAAGKGTRLAQGSPSPKPKVLYEVGGRPIILHTLEILKQIELQEIILVIGHKGNMVKQVVGSSYKFAVQKQRLGTGHATKVGLTQVSIEAQTILVINGDDSAFYKPQTISNLLDKHHNEKNTITFITLEPKDTTGLGRILRKDGKVAGIVEEKVATPQQKNIREVNDGAYVLDRFWAESILKKLKRSKTGEFYLTDLIHIALGEGKKVETYKLEDPTEWKGINTIEELQEADSLMRKNQSSDG